MSCYLGFTPTDRPNYFFVSYNSEDMDRVGMLAQRLCRSNVPLWYDHGLEYGEKWEYQISQRLRDAQAVLLFFTKGILTKSHSYVRKEYEMATKYFDRKVYVVMLDRIEKGDVPFDKVSWWIDVQENQCIDVSGLTDREEIVGKILAAIGMTSHEEKMNSLIRNYRALFDDGRQEEAEQYLAAFLHGQTLAGKAQLMANLVCGDLVGGTASPFTAWSERLDPPLIDGRGEKHTLFMDGHRLKLGDVIFTVGCHLVFHRGARGDADAIQIWRGEEHLFARGGLIEACRLQLHYDREDDILYLCYCSDTEETVDGELVETTWQSVIAIEDPLGEAICHDFPLLRKV